MQGPQPLEMVHTFPLSDCYSDGPLVFTCTDYGNVLFCQVSLQDESSTKRVENIFCLSVENGFSFISSRLFSGTDQERVAGEAIVKVVHPIVSKRLLAPTRQAFLFSIQNPSKMQAVLGGYNKL